MIDALIDAAARDLGDFFIFHVGRTDDPPDRFGGAHRFQVTASLAGRPFEVFALDVGHDGEPASIDILKTPDLLGFAGVAPVAVPAISLAVQVAEKLHAYTRLYEGGRVSSRTKDLVDLALITQLFGLDAEELQRTIEAVFVERGTHERPRSIPKPPSQWRVPFRQLARTIAIEDDLDVKHATVAGMLDPLLHHHVRSGSWDPDAQRWIGGASTASER